MPAVTVDNPLVLPRIPLSGIAVADADHATEATGPVAARPIARVVAAHHAVEGAGFEVWRPFPGALDLHATDPFLLLDQLGPVHYGPGEAKGAPWHPHRGFETVTYMLDGEMSHHDSNGGGGVIGEGDTQWMTAGAGILHDELPSERALRAGGRSHGVQLWVNLPSSLKFTAPRYQAIEGDHLTLLSSADGGALVRLIAGDLGAHHGPGVTHTPITYAHATVYPGAELTVPWNPAFNALAYVLEGRGFAGPDARPLNDHDLAMFGSGDTLTVRAADAQSTDAPHFEVLLLGGLPIREPIAHYGPFVMNTREEIIQAIEDYQAGRMGTVPATDLAEQNRNDMNDDLATVSISVNTAPGTDPGAIAVLLDLLGSAGMHATWSVPDDADPSLRDRLFFDAHAVVEPGPAATVAPTDEAPIEWLHRMQITLGRALETRGDAVVPIDTTMLDRAEGIVVVGEVLDLVKGLVRAERVRVVAPEPSSDGFSAIGDATRRE